MFVCLSVNDVSGIAATMSYTIKTDERESQHPTKGANVLTPLLLLFDDEA